MKNNLNEHNIKYGVSFWCNLKGYHDIAVFDYENEALEFAKKYEEAYDEWYNGDYVDDEEADFAATVILQPILDDIDTYGENATVETEIYGGVIENGKWDKYGDGDYIVEIVAECDYGY